MFPHYLLTARLIAFFVWCHDFGILFLATRAPWAKQACARSRNSHDEGKQKNFTRYGAHEQRAACLGNAGQNGNGNMFQTHEQPFIMAVCFDLEAIYTSVPNSYAGVQSQSHGVDLLVFQSLSYAAKANRFLDYDARQTDAMK